MAESTYDKFRKLLAELFMFDRADLDFGIYRIMNAKRDEVTRFFDNDLLPQVKTTLGEVDLGQRQQLQAELEEAEKAAGLAGFNPDDSPRVQDLRQALKAGGDPEVLEAEVFSHLYSFFRRYYKDGDFISLRRYKEGVYAIPYEGEDVKLYWANHDQYYIKSGEYFRDYAFKLPDGRRVHFKLVQADEERDNTKAAAGQERRFILSESEAVHEEDGELVIPFEYRPDEQKRKRDELVAQAAERILADQAAAAWLFGLAVAVPTEKNPKRTLLERHLNEYTARNSFDYFIHKDLGGFLRRELDFYIKNEVMHLDDIESEGEQRVIQYLAKIKAIRRIAHKIIDFLAQLEDFQKKLWLKKKFVVEANYCVTLDRVPEELYAEIAANGAQREGWVRLFGIDEIEFDLAQPGYSQPLTVAFLKANPSLVVDTVHFGSEFKERLLANFDDLDEQTDGVLIHGENFQALNLLQDRYREHMKCIYIDPPYNTGGDGFPYRDDYQHSSWIAMVTDRLILNRQLLAPGGVVYTSIDANERVHLEFTMSAVFGRSNRVEEIIWVTNATKNRSPTYSTNHEYVEVFARDISAAKREIRMFREPKPGLDAFQDLVTELGPSYPPVHDIEKRIRGLLRENRQDSKGATGDSGESEESNGDWKGLHNYTRAEYRDDAGRYVPESLAREKKASIWIWTESDGSMPQVKEDSQKAEFRDPNHPAFRFYRPLHPFTKSPCPHPKTGWRWPHRPYGKQSTSFTELDADERIAWGDTDTKVPRTKRFLHEVETNVAKSVVLEFSDGEKELYNLFGKSRAFSNPKPTALIARFVQQTTWNGEFVQDYFAGSGTTGHAVINLNRKDGGRRRFILVEMGDHFDTVLMPRLEKVTYAPDWKDGKPTRLATPEELERGPHLIKYVRLESYEDALNNLSLRRTDDQDQLLAQHSDMREDYTLRYMLDVESEGSASLLDLDQFEDPFSYTLQIGQGSVGETRPVTVDLVETFNYLIGLRVQHIDSIRGFKVVEGASPQGEHVLVIWRNTRETSNADLDDFFQKQGYNTRDTEFDVIYVNGDNNLENLRRPDETWKVRLIEDDFKRLMFDVEDV